MTAENQDILEDFYSANDKFISVTVVDATGSAKNLTGAEIVYTIYTDKGIISVRKSSANGEIGISGGSNNIATVTLNSYDTISLSGLYRHEMTVTDSNNDTETVMRGKVQIYKSYATRQRKQSKHVYLKGV